MQNAQHTQDGQNAQDGQRTQRTQDGPGTDVTRRGAAQSSVRAHNLAAVARFVRSTGGCSRRDIGDALRLNKGTVSGLVGELIGRGLLEGGGSQPRGVGRPSRLVQTDTRKHASIVVEVLSGRAVVSSWTLSLESIRTHTVDFPAGGRSAVRCLDRLREALSGTAGELRGEGRTVTGVVTALPGLVDTSEGTLVRSAPLGWDDVPVRELLRREPLPDGLPVFVDRVASLATLAESRALPGCSDLICLHGGESGLGAGVITGGRILKGGQGRAGELLFPTLRATPGHPETDVSALLRHVPEQTAPHGPHALDRLATALGLRLATLVALLDPQTVVLAGDLAPLTGSLAPMLRERLDAAWSPHPGPDVPVSAGEHGRESALIGGAVMLADRVFGALSPPAGAGH